MITIIDIETTFKKINNKSDPSPWVPENFIVSVGWQSLEGDAKYVCLHHNEEPETPDGDVQIQKMLDATTVLVAHNAKFDLQWLLECGYKYTGKVWCTMVTQFVMNCGERMPLDLESCCKQHGLEQTKKVDEIKEYLNKGIGFERMPWPLVQKYGMQDINLCTELFLSQMEVLNLKQQKLLNWATFIL